MKLQTLSQTSLSVVDVVEQIVRSRTCGMIRGLRVEVVDGTIILSGRAGTYYTKQLATHAALKAAGDMALINSIEVC